MGKLTGRNASRATDAGISPRRPKAFWKRVVLAVAVMAVAAAALGAGLLAKYVMVNDREAEMIAAGFHVSSEYLAEVPDGGTVPTYTMTPTGADGEFTIDLHNWEVENTAQVSEVPVTYTIAVQGSVMRSTPDRGYTATLNTGDDSVLFSPVHTVASGDDDVLRYEDLPTEKSLAGDAYDASTGTYDASYRGYRVGYTLEGWYTDPSLAPAAKVTADTTLTAATTLYAKWEPRTVSYTVIHMIEGPEGGPGEGKYTPYKMEIASALTGTKITAADVPDIADKTIPGDEGDGAWRYHVAGTTDGHPEDLINPYLGVSATEANGTPVMIGGDGMTIRYVYWNRNRALGAPSYNSVTAATDNKYNGYVKPGENLDIVDPGRVVRDAMIAGGRTRWRYRVNGVNVDYNHNLNDGLPEDTKLLIAGGMSGFVDGVLLDAVTTDTWKAGTDPKREIRWYDVDGDTEYDPSTVTVVKNIGGTDVTFYKHSVYDAIGSTAAKGAWGGAGYEYGLVSANYQDVAYNTQKDGFVETTTYRRWTQVGIIDDVTTVEVYRIRKTHNLVYANLSGSDFAALEGSPVAIKWESDLKNYMPRLQESVTRRVIGGVTYRFKGWFDDSVAANNPNSSYAEDHVFDWGGKMGSSDIIVYAGWEPVEHTVTLEANGGAINDGTSAGTGRRVLSATSGSRLSAPSVRTRMEGDVEYTLAGWYADAAFTKAWNFVTDKVTADTTLYAKWITGNVEDSHAVSDEEGGDVDTNDGVRVLSPDVATSHTLHLIPKVDEHGVAKPVSVIVTATYRTPDGIDTYTKVLQGTFEARRVEVSTEDVGGGVTRVRLVTNQFTGSVALTWASSMSPAAGVNEARGWSVGYEDASGPEASREALSQATYEFDFVGSVNDWSITYADDGSATVTLSDA